MLYSIKFIRRRLKNNDEEFKLLAVKIKTGHREHEN